MTQDKMRRLITACVSAATVLLVFLLGYLIFQWITLSVGAKREAELKEEIAYLEQLKEEAENDLEYYKSDLYLNWKLIEFELDKNRQGK